MTDPLDGLEKALAEAERDAAQEFALLQAMVGDARERLEALLAAAEGAADEAEDEWGAARARGDEVWSAATDLHHEAHGFGTPFKFCRADACAALRDAVDPGWRDRFDAARGLRLPG